MTTAVRTPATTARPLPLLGLAEIAFALVSLTAVIGLRRVFLAGDWTGVLVLQVVAAHGTVVALRRLRLATPTAAALGAVAGVVAISWAFAGDLTTFGVPTATTFDALRTSIDEAFAQFSEVKAPTEALDGFLIAVSGGIWAGAIIGDWAAFRVGASVEAVLPAASLFGVAAVLGADIDRILVTGLWIAAVLAFVLFRRAERLGRTSAWVGDAGARGPRTLVALGVLLALAATLVAAALGPRLPGADADAIVSLTDIGDDGPGTRVTVSPLVDIRSRLVDQADVEVFTVRSDVRSYWRLTSLDRFDGRIWSSNGSYGRSDGDLDDGVPVASERITFEQRYQIRALSQIWLPAAYEPQEVAVEDAVRYDEVSGTLIVDTEVPTSDGTAYGVLSALPQHDPAALAGATTAVPPEIAERYLDLPAGFSPAVRDFAAQLVAGSTSTYEAMRRLQDFFRDEFTYSLEIGSGHDQNAIERFLFETRAGYCEQFAGTFAAMARSLGVPARVAVGFTPGNADPADPAVFRVRGEHAHAWPEVYLGEFGWVAFEPTPGRGAPFAEQYTGVPEQQAETGNPTTATTTVSPPSTQAPTTPTTAPSVRPDGFDQDEFLDSGQSGDDQAAPNPWPGRIAWTTLAVVVVALGYAVVVLVASEFRRRSRRRRATSPSAQVALAWDESLSSVRRTGVPVRPAETQSQAAARIGRRLPAVDEPLRILASSVESAAYAPTGPDEVAGLAALVLADDIEHGVVSTLTPRERVVRRLHPSRLRD